MISRPTPTKESILAKLAEARRLANVGESRRGLVLLSEAIDEMRQLRVEKPIAHQEVLTP